MNATAKVSQHIHDISPSLTLRRDKAYTTYPSNRRRRLRPPMEAIEEIDQNYAWKKLPNIGAYKNAIVRNKVCEGLMYLLPSNKNATSLARPYSTELGAMFNEPYHRFKPEEYNEENVMQSSKVHFSPNTHTTRLTKFEEVTRNSYDLNSDSKASYHMYSTLANKNEKPERREGKGNLPVQVRIGQAEQELQEDVDGILAAAGLDQFKVDSDQTGESKPPITTSATGSAGRTVAFQEQEQSHTSQQELTVPLRRIREFKGQSYERKSASYANYNELRNAAVPHPRLPDDMKSRYLNEQKIQEIWNWLNWDFKKTKFQQFLEVCS